MSLRLIECILPAGETAESVKELLGELPVINIWEESGTNTAVVVKIVTLAKNSEEILDTLEKHYSGKEVFRIVLLTVEATIPRPDVIKEEPSVSAPEKEKESVLKIGRISREELYADINESADITLVYIIMVVLSSVVASIGILNDNVAIIIGAMVIAPLIGPSIALAFGTTLCDLDLMYRAFKANAVGFAVALILSVAIGALYSVDPGIEQLALRTEVGLGDVAIALASGVAGTLAFTQGLPSALIGVMVAVALLPPTVSVGMLAGSGNLVLAAGALQLLLVNIICINLSAVSTFFVQGVRPLLWWEVKKAKKATRNAIIIWSVLLIVLILTILISRGYITI